MLEAKKPKLGLDEGLEARGSGSDSQRTKKSSIVAKDSLEVLITHL